jgi:hypothetical protein
MEKTGNANESAGARGGHLRHPGGAHRDRVLAGRLRIPGDPVVDYCAGEGRPGLWYFMHLPRVFNAPKEITK